MTRIITICSGIDRVGTTHLTLNIALEMVRRGRQAAIFSQGSSSSSIDDLLALPRSGLLQRRSTDHGDSLLRRGYLGVDILASVMPLSQWDRADGQLVQKLIADMDCADGYDDFLVDTSGMDARTLLACCRASSRLLLVITAEPRSRSEAFALLRILQLNGFQGDLYLLINQLDPAADAKKLYVSFNRKLKKYLGLDVPLLGVLPHDVHVRRAEHGGQAFTSLFPDAEVSSRIGAVADAIDAADSQATIPSQSLGACLNSFRENLALPVSLPGGVVLQTADDDGETAVMQASPVRESASEVMLLQLDSSFHRFCDALDSLPGLLQASADDISDLHRLLEEAADRSWDADRDMSDSIALPQLAAELIREIEEAVVPAQVLQLQVNENRVRSDDPDWLRVGCYLKYSVRFQGQEEVVMRVRSFLAGVSAFNNDYEVQGETLWEMVVADRSAAMNIVHSVDDNIRVQLWLPLRNRAATAHASQSQIATPTVAPGNMIH
ncbi:MAG: hypothetical protein WBN57_07055 [Gammaproteobacteria bacterium]